MKKVLFLMQLPPPVHGQSFVNRQIIESEIIKRNIDVDLIKIDFAKKINDIGKLSWGKSVYLLIFIYNLIKKVISFRPNLVYFTVSLKGHVIYRDFIIILVLKIFKVEYLLKLHETGIKQIYKNYFKRRVIKIIFKNSKVILLSYKLYFDVSQFIKIENVYFINNCIPFSTQEKVDVLKELTTRGDYEKVRFLFLSNLFYEKGIIDLLDALEQIPLDIQKHLSISIAGAPKSKYLMNEINGRICKLKHVNIKLYEFVDGYEKNNLFRDSDVFLFLSHIECYPIVLLEALKKGLPIISTDVGANSDLVTNNYNGFLIYPQNPIEISKNMVKYIINRNMIKQHALNSLKHYEDNFNYEEWQKKYNAIIIEVLG